MITKTIIENVLILVGESFWVFSTAAQLERLIRTGNKTGLSPVSQTITAAGNIAWTAYFVSRNLLVPIVTNLMMLVIVTTTLGYALSNKKQFGKGLLAIIIVGPLTAYVLLALPHASGWLGVAYNEASAAPWIYHLIKTKRASGISRHAILFAYGAIACTLAYAIMIVAWPLIVGCLIGIASESLIAAYYYNYRHH